MTTMNVNKVQDRSINDNLVDPAKHAAVNPRSRDVFTDTYEAKIPKPSKVARRTEYRADVSGGMPYSTSRQTGHSKLSLETSREVVVTPLTNAQTDALLSEFSSCLKEQKLPQAWKAVKPLLAVGQGRDAVWELAQAYAAKSDITQALNLLEAADCELPQSPATTAFCETWLQQKCDPVFISFMVEGLNPNVRNAVAKSFHQIYLAKNDKEGAFWMAGLILDEQDCEDALLTCAAKWAQEKV